MQLSGQVTNPLDNVTYFYAWDRVDQGAKEYLDRTVARFTSRAPRANQPVRYLSNLYLISIPDAFSSQLEEIHPADGDLNLTQTLSFRFIARTQYN